MPLPEVLPARINLINDVLNDIDPFRLTVSDDDDDPYITEAEDIAGLINEGTYRAVDAILHVLSRRFGSYQVSHLDCAVFETLVRRIVSEGIM